MQIKVTETSENDALIIVNNPDDVYYKHYRQKICLSNTDVLFFPIITYYNSFPVNLNFKVFIIFSHDKATI